MKCFMDCPILSNLENSWAISQDFPPLILLGFWYTKDMEQQYTAN